MSISLTLSHPMICPRCEYKFEYSYGKQECPKCKLPFINTNYINGWIISDWGIDIWAKECEDGEWRIPEGKYIFDEEEQERWGIKK